METRKIGSWNTVGYRMTLDMGGEATEDDGFPVRQEFQMGSIMSWQQLVSFSEEAAPKVHLRSTDRLHEVRLGI